MGMCTVEMVSKNVALVNDLSGRTDLPDLHRRYV